MSEDALIRLANLRALDRAPADLAREVGNSYQYWRDLLAGKKSFGEKAARNIEEKLGLTRGALDVPNGVQERSGDTTIPQYRAGGAMGYGLLLRDQPGLIRSWHVTPEWIQKNVPNCTSPRNLAIVTGFGDSMRPLYNPGDPLLVDTGVKTVEFDAIYFFRIGDEGFIKRLQRVPGEGLIAISENKAYRDWVIQDGMDFEVFARVVKVWRGEEF